MPVFFLVIIYITFISLGLPDSMLGSAWTVMRLELRADLAAAGIISAIITGGTIISSLSSERMIRRFKTGPVTVFSVFLTAAALLGFSFSTSMWQLALASVPLGLGAGAVDAGLNNYVAVHYKPHHMSWLHCFWGVGALLSPLVMARFLQNGDNWRGGYLFIGAIQLALTALLVFSLPGWLRQERDGSAAGNPNETEAVPDSNGVGALKIPGVMLAMLTFFCYCGVESLVSIWGASYLTGVKGLLPATAARWTSFFFIGITLGRFLTGFLTLKLSSGRLIRIGQTAVLAGVVLMMLPLNAGLSLFGLALAGLGCAPVFPCMIHETPHRFGVEKSQKIMGIQMASAYTGSTLIPPLTGLAASKLTGIGIYPYVLLFFSAVMLLASERLNRIVKRRDAEA